MIGQETSIKRWSNLDWLIEADARWEDQVKQAGLPPTEPVDDPAVTIVTESRPRAPPQVHGALRASDPQRPASERTFVKKARPTTLKEMPSGFVRGPTPPLIGLQATTPTTPAGLTVPPPAVLLQPAEPPHPHPEPAQDGPTPKQARERAFPRGLAAPTPKLPPIGFTPLLEQQQPQQQQQQQQQQQAAPGPAQRPPSPCAAAAQPHEDQQAAFEAALGDAKRHSFKIKEYDPNQPRLIEYVSSPDDIDWGRSLHEQLKPRLWGQPSIEKTPAELRLLRSAKSGLTEQHFHDLVRSYDVSNIEALIPRPTADTTSTSWKQ